MEPPTSNPYKLSVRRNRDLIRQYNQVPGRSQGTLQSSREVKQPYIVVQGQNILQYPLGYDPHRYSFREQPEEGFCGCLSDKTDAEIYISPSQVISMRQFAKDSQCYYCFDHE